MYTPEEEKFFDKFKPLSIEEEKKLTEAKIKLASLQRKTRKETEPEDFQKLISSGKPIEVRIFTAQGKGLDEGWRVVGITTDGLVRIIKRDGKKMSEKIVSLEEIKKYRTIEENT